MEALRRRVNDEIAALAARYSRLSSDDFQTFVCECSDPACRGELLLSIDDYRVQASRGYLVAH